MSLLWLTNHPGPKYFQHIVRNILFRQKKASDHHLAFALVKTTIGAENITYIKRIGGNSFNVTRCNALHHLKKLPGSLLDVTSSGVAASEL